MPLTLPGLTVSIRSADSPDREEIPVFKPETINSGLVSGFIPSEAGQLFEVWVDNDLVSGEGLVYTTYIDGREMDQLAVFPFETSSMQGVYCGDEDDGEAPSFDISKLGLIEVQICRANLTVLNNAPPDDRGPLQASLDPVSEKAKKVGWHSVSLGIAKPTNDNGRTCRQDCIDPPSKPYAVFRFRYKPRMLLEDEGIAPRAERPKAPEPSTGDKRPRREEGEIEGPSAKRPATKKVKPEPFEGSSQLKSPKVEGTKKVKTERDEVIDLTNRAPSPIHVPVRGEVIDLSDD